MHAKPDLRVFLKWMISGSGSVITDVIQLSTGNMKRIRFSLKTAATLVFVLALAFAFPVRRYLNSIGQSKLVSELETAGAKVGKFNSKYHTRTAVDRMYESIGFPSYTHVYNLNIVNQDGFDEELLAQGMSLRELCFLSIDNSTIGQLDDSDAMDWIANHANSNLRFIDIAHSDVTSEDLIQFCKIPSLKMIYICYCPNITSQGRKRLIDVAKANEIAIHIGKGIAE